MGNFLSKALSLLIGLAIIWFGVAPYYAFFALRSAAQANDTGRMAELVDYPKVRASLRDQLEPGRAGGPPPNIWEDPIGALRRSLEPMQAAPAADSYLTPQAIAALTRGEGRDARRAGQRADDDNDDNWISRPYPAYSFWGPGTARLLVRDDEHGPTTFTFSRKGLSWKLVHVGLPPANDGTTVAPAQAPAPAPAR
jgi:hypothetical protein